MNSPPEHNNGKVVITGVLTSLGAPTGTELVPRLSDDIPPKPFRTSP